MDYSENGRNVQDSRNPQGRRQRGRGGQTGSQTGGGQSGNQDSGDSSAR